MKRFIFLIFLLLSCLLCGSAFMWGKGGVIQFSTSSYQRRSFIEFRVPILNFRIYRTGWKYDTPQIFTFLIKRGYLQETKHKAGEQWITTNHWSSHLWRDGHSTFHKVFYWYDDKLIAWSKKNPDKSRNLWVNVIELIKKGGRDHLNQAAKLVRRTTGV